MSKKTNPIILCGGNGSGVQGNVLPNGLQAGLFTFPGDFSRLSAAEMQTINYETCRDVAKARVHAEVEMAIEIDGYKNFVFTSKSGMPLAPNAVNNVLYNIVKAYNKFEQEQAKSDRRKPVLLPKISAHIMRHTGCTRMAESGMDPKVLQYIMGHADCSITMNVYNHVSSLERIKKEVERIEKDSLAMPV